jgi:very-short-patch-repair endonuclease
MVKRKKISFKDLEEIALKNNGKILSSEYIKSITKYEWKCDVEAHPIFLMSHNQIISKNTWCPECGRIKQANSQRGKPGTPFSEERKKQFSIIAKEKGFGKWMKGKIIPEETRLKISQSNKGRKCYEETKQKISEKNKGKKNGMFAKTHSDEIKKIISECSKRAWNNESTRAKMEIWKNSEEGKEAARKGQRKAQLLKKFHYTKPELQVAELLTEYNIEFEHQVEILDIQYAYVCDFYIKDLNLIIEVDGKYWHNYPYGNEIDIKREMQLTYKNYNLMRVWENEIDKNLIYNIIDLKNKYLDEK